MESPEVAAADPAVPAAVPETAVAEGSAPVVETPSLFESFKSKFGVEATDEASLFGHYESVLAKAKQLDEVLPKLTAAEARKLEYQSEASEQVDLFAAKLKQGGITDPKEIRAKVREFIEESDRDYMAMASTNPAKVVEIALRKANPEISDRAVAVKLRQYGVGSEPDPNDDSKYQGATDPAYIADREEYLDKLELLKMDALDRAKELEAGKAKLDFQPKEAKSAADVAAQKEAEIKEIEEGYVREAQAFKAGFKGFKVGGEDIPVSQAQVEDFYAKFMATPEADAMLERLMNPHTPEGFREFAEAALLKQMLPTIRENDRKAAYSAALKDFEKGIFNPNFGQPRAGGGADDGVTIPLTPDQTKAWFDQHGAFPLRG